LFFSFYVFLLLSGDAKMFLFSLWLLFTYVPWQAEKLSARRSSWRIRTGHLSSSQFVSFFSPPEESRKTNSNKRQKTRYFLFSFHGGWVQTHNTQPLVYCVRNEFITGAAPCIKLICFVDTVVISFRGCPVESIFSFDRPSRNARPSFPIAFLFYFSSSFIISRVRWGVEKVIWSSIPRRSEKSIIPKKSTRPLVMRRRNDGRPSV
jgi:hypothetical protein